MLKPSLVIFLFYHLCLAEFDGLRFCDLIRKFLLYVQPFIEVLWKAPFESSMITYIFSDKQTPTVKRKKTDLKINPKPYPPNDFIMVRLMLRLIELN